MVDDRTSILTAKALPPGYRILWYTIEKVLGQGGFGITYLAHDENLDRSVAIKEYLPTPFAYRHDESSVKPLTGDHRDQFAWGLDSFLKEAQTLAKFGHDNIVRVYSVFEQNSTAYMVMDYERGLNLASVYHQRRGQLDQAFFEQVFFPIFVGLKEIHAFGFIHRDIKPANIIIRENQTPVLIDFGSARQTSQQQSGEMTALVTQGYTPLEQYSPNYGEQGPWTDIYALAATIYEGVVGRKPEESLSRSACILRSVPDVMQPLSTTEYPAFSQPFLDAVFGALALQPAQRPADLTQWLNDFYQHAVAKTPRSEGFTGTFDDGVTRVQPLKRAPAVPPAVPPAATAVAIPPPAKRRPVATEVTTRAQKAVPRPQAAKKLAAKPEDEFDFLSRTFKSDDETDDYTRVAMTGDPAPGKAKGNSPAGKILTALLMVLITAAGVYWFVKRPLDPPAQQVAETTMVTTPLLASLDTLPAPGAPLEISLPKDIVRQQLDEMLSMADVYNRAYQLDPENAEMRQLMESAFDRLKRIASQWSSSGHPALSARLMRVANQIPLRGQQYGELVRLIETSDQRSDKAALLARLEAGKIVLPYGDSVLDIVGQLNHQDLAEVVQLSEWQSMLASYRQTALEKIQLSDFDAAATLVAAALTLQPDDAGMVQIRQHLLLR